MVCGVGSYFVRGSCVRWEVQLSSDYFVSWDATKRVGGGQVGRRDRRRRRREGGTEGGTEGGGGREGQKEGGEGGKRRGSGKRKRFI